MQTLIRKLLLFFILCSVALGSELTGRRNYNSKTFKQGGQFTSEIHTGHIHYKDTAGDYQDVDFTIEDKGAYWQMVKASYRLYIAKDFGAPRLIRFDNRFNGANHTIYFEPHSLQWVNKNNPADRVLIRAAQSVTGILSNSPNHTITYKNAFGNKVDFVIELRRHGFRKYIRFNSKPTLSPPSSDYVPVLLHKYEATGLKLRANNKGSDWDNDSYYESDDGFSLSETIAQYKTRLRKAHIWDSSAISRRQRLKVYWEKRNGVLWLAKVLPKAFLANAFYPVMADLSADYYSNAGGDGHLAMADEATWNDAHDSATADIITAAETLAEIQSMFEDPVFHCVRVQLPFDTSLLADNASISAVILTVYVTEKTDNEADAQSYINVVESSQADPTALHVDHYNDWVDMDKGATDLDIGTDITAAAANVFTFNATGRGWVNKTGWTKLGMLEGHDIEDVAPDAGQSRIIIRTSNFANLASDPKLTVTYTIPSAAAGQVIIISKHYLHSDKERIREIVYKKVA